MAPIRDYSNNPNANTTINGINIAEGCLPSGINNAIRNVMADVKALNMTGNIVSFASVADLLSSSAMTYGTGAGQVATGDTVEAGGFRYTVAASGATDHHVTTAGGVKMYVLPAASGARSVSALGISGAANDALNSLLLVGDVLVDVSISLSVGGSTVVVPAGRALRQKPGVTISVPEGWTNKPAIEVAGQVEGLVLRETNASAVNAAKNTASNIGISVVGKKAKIIECFVEGFGFPFAARDLAANGSVDDAFFVRCHAEKGYSWGFEVDSAQGVIFDSCTATMNGLDGFKQVAQRGSPVRLARRNRYVTCTAMWNGQRDTAAGGAEATNGNGWDLFQGGIGVDLVGCVANYNYGSGINIKGGTTSHPEMGQNRIIGGEMSFNRATNAGNSHGIELGGDIALGTGSVGQNLLSVTSARIEGNEGAGLNNGGSYGVACVGVTFLRNRVGNVVEQIGSEVTYSACHFVQGAGFNVVVGRTNDGTMKRKNARFIGCLFAASYDPFMAASSTALDTPREQRVISEVNTGTDTITSVSHGFAEGEVISIYRSGSGATMPGGLSEAATYWVRDVTANTFTLSSGRYSVGRVDITTTGGGTLVATRDSAEGITVLSDSDGVFVQGCTFVGHWSRAGHFSNRGGLTIRDSYFHNSFVSYGSQVASTAVLVMSDCSFADLDTSVVSTAGGIALSSGASDLRRLTAVKTSGGPGRLIVMSDGSGPHRWDDLTATGFSITTEVNGTVTFAANWTQRGRGAAAPTGTSAYWTRGAIVENSTPSAAGVPGWVCVTAGAPGTWKAQAVLAA